MVPRKENTLADELYVISSTFEVSKSLSQQECKLEVLFIPSIPHNQDHWNFFYDDAQIICFLNASQSPMISFEDQLKGRTMMDRDMIEITIPLEKIFNRRDEYKGRRAELIEINILSYVSP